MNYFPLLQFIYYSFNGGGNNVVTGMHVKEAAKYHIFGN